MKHLRAALLALPCVLALVAVAGCGSSTGTVAGRVTLEGEPVVGAELEFQSEVDERMRCSAIVLPDGTYQVDYGPWDGIPVGRCRVTVTHYTLRNGQPLPEGEEGYSLRETNKVVKKQVTFVKDISKGTNDIDFEMADGTAAEQQ